MWAWACDPRSQTAMDQRHTAGSQPPRKYHDKKAEQSDNANDHLSRA